MHPAYSVILFTTASGAGYGLLALLGLVRPPHGPASRPDFALPSSSSRLALIVSGSSSSTFHLGHPERAWRAFSQWRSSWLSREGVASMVDIWPGAHLRRIVDRLIEAPQLIGVRPRYSSDVRRHRLLHGQDLLDAHDRAPLAQPLTIAVYLAFALATGATLLAAIAWLFGRLRLSGDPCCLWRCPRGPAEMAVWRSLDALPGRTPSKPLPAWRASAACRQWEVPHTAENFVMQEMGYAVARKHALKLRLLVFLLLGLACLDMLAALALPMLSILAALTALAAAVVERWLFFAEAQHASTLYYGAKTA